ncbi:hypothetical protein D3C83_249210 [compost metagenome]
MALAGSVSADSGDAFAATKRALRAPLLELLEGVCRERDREAMLATAMPSSNRAQTAALERLKRR